MRSWGWCTKPRIAVNVSQSMPETDVNQSGLYLTYGLPIYVCSEVREGHHQNCHSSFMFRTNQGKQDTNTQTPIPHTMFNSTHFVSSFSIFAALFPEQCGAIVAIDFKIIKTYQQRDFFFSYHSACARYCSDPLNRPVGFSTFFALP